VLLQYNFTLTYRPSITNLADRLLRRLDYIAKAKAPLQKNNKVFVTAIRDLLSRNKELSLQISAVIT
jgi:hypothetical protein